MWFSGSTLAFHAWDPQFKAQDHNERDKDTLPTVRGSPTKPSLGAHDAQCIFFPMASLPRVKWLWQSPRADLLLSLSASHRPLSC